jgi:hypothetical protein
MDSGKVTVKIPADLMTLEAVGAVADKLRVALRRSGLGDVVSRHELAYEPFAPDTPEFGRRWHEIVLNLERALDSRRVAGLLLAAGAPRSAHITYTDQMRMCGDSLGRV